MKLKNLLLIFIGISILSSCGKNFNTNTQLKSDVDIDQLLSRVNNLNPQEIQDFLEKR